MLVFRPLFVAFQTESVHKQINTKYQIQAYYSEENEERDDGNVQGNKNEIRRTENLDIY